MGQGERSRRGETRGGHPSSAQAARPSPPPRSTRRRRAPPPRPHPRTRPRGGSRCARPRPRGRPASSRGRGRAPRGRREKPIARGRRHSRRWPESAGRASSGQGRFQREFTTKARRTQRKKRWRGRPRDTLLQMRSVRCRRHGRSRHPGPGERSVLARPPARGRLRVRPRRGRRGGQGHARFPVPHHLPRHHPAPGHDGLRDRVGPGRAAHVAGDGPVLAAKGAELRPHPRLRARARGMGAHVRHAPTGRGGGPPARRLLRGRPSSRPSGR